MCLAIRVSGGLQRIWGHNVGGRLRGSEGPGIRGPAARLLLSADEVLPQLGRQPLFAPRRLIGFAQQLAPYTGRRQMEIMAAVLSE